MNIFEALSSGKGSVNEENVSSFIAYLLQADAGHDLKDIFLKKFINLIENKCGIKNILSINDTPQILLEECYECGNKKRYIDILINVNGKIYIAIENKISKGALQKDQLQDEYDFIRTDALKYLRDTQLIMVMLAPKGEKFEEKVEALKLQPKKNDKKVFISWNEIIEIIKTIINEDELCKISPIMNYTKMTLKSFVYYMENMNNAKILREITVVYSQDEKYTICQLSNGKFYIKENEDLITKHLLFDVLCAISDGKKTYNETIYSNTTRTLGNEVFKACLGNLIKITNLENRIFKNTKIKKQNR